MMKLKVENGVRILQLVLIIMGLGAIGLAFCADRIGIGGETGLGVKQITLVIVGLITLVFAIYFQLPPGRLMLERLISPSEETGKPVSILWLSVWFGLLTGFAEALYFLYQKASYVHFLGRSHHFVWMTPFSEVLIFVIPGLLLYLVTRRSLQPAWMFVSIFVFSFLGYLSLLFLFERLHLYAQLFLALGLAVQTSRMAVAQRLRFFTLVRFSIGWLVTGMFILSTGLLIFIP